MNRKVKYGLISAVIFILGIGIFFKHKNFSLQSMPRFGTLSTPVTDMKYCESAGDCVPVECRCKCAGCGFSYDDIINKKYVDKWYKQHNCTPTNGIGICPQVCCNNNGEIACENNSCTVKEKRTPLLIELFIKLYLLKEKLFSSEN